MSMTGIIGGFKNALVNSEFKLGIDKDNII